MSKLYTYLAIMSGVMLVFYFAGLTSECIGDDKIPGTADDDTYCENNGAHSTILNLVIRPQSMQVEPGEAQENLGFWERITQIFDSTTLYTKVALALLLLGTVGSVSIGFLNTNPELAARSAVATYLLVLGFDFTLVYTKVADSTNFVIATLLFSPLMMIYIITVLDWMGKTD